MSFAWLRESNDRDFSYLEPVSDRSMVEISSRAPHEPDRPQRFRASQERLVLSFREESHPGLIKRLASVSQHIPIFEAFREDPPFAVIMRSNLDVLSNILELIGVRNDLPLADAIPALRDTEREGRLLYIVPQAFTLHLKDALPSRKVDEILDTHGIQRVIRHRHGNLYTCFLSEGQRMSEFLPNFRQQFQEDLCSAEAMGFELDVRAGRIPEAPLLASSWALHNCGQWVGAQRGMAHIDAIGAWRIRPQVSQNVVLVVIDGAIDHHHPDLYPNLVSKDPHDWRKWDFKHTRSQSSPPGPYRTPSDVHGSHVAGIACAQNSRSSLGMVGLAHGCQLLPLRIPLDCTLHVEIAESLAYMLDAARADKEHRFVVNCSWAIEHMSNCIHKLVREATALSNVLIVAGAGNDGQDLTRFPKYPASWKEVTTVAATDQNDQQWIGEAVLTGYQQQEASNFGKCVDISAPGKNILGPVPGGGYHLDSGTSFAAPLVSGLALLIWSHDKRLTSKQVRELLSETGDPISDKRISGKRINARCALERVERKLKSDRCRAK